MKRFKERDLKVKDLLEKGYDIDSITEMVGLKSPSKKLKELY